MKYRDPDSGRFITQKQWEGLQGDEVDYFDDYEDFDDYEFFDEEEYLGEG